MFRKGFLVLFAIVLFAAFDVHAYFFSATDGPNLFLFKTELSTNGSLAVLSEFKYTAPGTMGSTALLTAPGSTATKKVFDLFGVFSSAGKPVLFRDRVEFSETSGTWRHVSRKLFRTHKLSSYNTISSAALSDLAAEISANERFLLTQNGTDINLRKVTGAGKLKGPNKPSFDNPSGIQPLSAAISPNGNFAVQSFFASSAAGSGGPANTVAQPGLSIKNVQSNLIAHYVVSGSMFSLALAEQIGLCMAFVEMEDARSGATEQTAATKTGVFYINFDKDTLRPGKVVTIAKKTPVTLFQHQIFNTAFLLPDGKGIVFSKEKSGKLEFLHQPLNGSCGPKQGKPKPFLPRTNPVIANNNPIYGWAAAACAAGEIQC